LALAIKEDASVDNNLVVGDSMRLLMRVAVYAAAEYNASTPPEGLSPASMRGSLSGAHLACSSTDTHADFEEGVTLESWLALCRTHSILGRHGLTEDDAVRIFDDVTELFTETCHVRPVPPSCGPLLLELLVQQVGQRIGATEFDTDIGEASNAGGEDAGSAVGDAAQNEVDIDAQEKMGRSPTTGPSPKSGKRMLIPPQRQPEALICDILWRRCGWDSPVGRRLLRRLRQVFHNYAKNGELSQKAFLRFAEHAGFAQVRGTRAGHGSAKLSMAFTDTVREAERANFSDFLRLVESCAKWSCGNGVCSPWPVLEMIATTFLDNPRGGANNCGGGTVLHAPPPPYAPNVAAVASSPSLLSDGATEQK